MVMRTGALEVVRFRRRYYIRYHHHDGSSRQLGDRIVARIPPSAEEYKKWLETTRKQYAAKECALEQHVYAVCGEKRPKYPDEAREFATLPSELPRLDKFNAESCYVINLDYEVLTINSSIHWKLGTIPREGDLWCGAIVDSLDEKKNASLAAFPEAHMASLSLALELPQRNEEMDYDSCTVIPRTDIGEARKAILTLVLAEVLVEYENVMIQFGREWCPDSFPFRELAFALVSIASGQAKFHSLPAERCNPRHCTCPSCKPREPIAPHGWVDREWAGDSGPLLEFGSMCHRPGESPGASPAETMYWLEDVLVSLALVPDGDAITKAVTWGTEQGRTNFQIVVMSLFTVAFGEVSSSPGTNRPYIKVSEPVHLSPLRTEHCMSKHPREHPSLQPGMHLREEDGEILIISRCTGTAPALRRHFRGLAALVNFFDVAASRRAASRSTGRLPSEMYALISDFVDYDTWKTCLVTSQELRYYCLRKYRLDDRMSIVEGPFERLSIVSRPFERVRVDDKKRLLSFDFEDMKTGKILPMMQDPRSTQTKECNWMPAIGSDRKIVMMDVLFQFEPAEDVPVEADSDDEG